MKFLLTTLYLISIKEMMWSQNGLILEIKINILYPTMVKMIPSPTQQPLPNYSRSRSNLKYRIAWSDDPIQFWKVSWKINKFPIKKTFIIRKTEQRWNKPKWNKQYIRCFSLFPAWLPTTEENESTCVIWSSCPLTSIKYASDHLQYNSNKHQQWQKLQKHNRNKKNTEKKTQSVGPMPKCPETQHWN